MSVTVNSPRVAQIQASVQPIVWSNTTPFNGYLLLTLQMPATGHYPNPTLWNSLQNVVLPSFIKIPIVGGVLDVGTRIFFNADITPPGTTYKGTVYDVWDNVIGQISSGSAFSITADPTSIVFPTLTVPA